MNDYKVYIHTNKENGMMYIGITQQDIETRWQGGNGYRKQSHFWRAIKKYGWDGFTHEVVASGLTKTQACDLEQELIEKYKTTNNRFGYNKSTGGESGARGVEKTQAQRTAASNALKEKWKDPEFKKKVLQYNLVRANAPEAIKKRAESNRGRVVSDETRKLMSEHRKGKKRGAFTEEHKKHMRENHAGGAEPVAVMCVETRKIFACINDAARETGIHKRQISGCCRHTPHYNTAGGYHWEYAQ